MKSLTFSSINADKQIMYSIPSTVTSISFMSCQFITIQQDKLLIESFELAESKECNIITSESVVQMKDNQLIIENIEDILSFDIPQTKYQLKNVKKANITSTNHIEIDSTPLESLILSFEIILDESIEIEMNSEKKCIHLENIDIQSLELNGMKYMDCYLPSTLTSLSLSYCNLLDISSLLAI